VFNIIISGDLEIRSVVAVSEDRRNDSIYLPLCKSTFYRHRGRYFNKLYHNRWKIDL